VSGGETRFLRPADLLRAKVVGDDDRRRGIDPDAVAAAEAVIRARAEYYPATALVEVELLEAAVRRAAAGDGGRASHLETIAGLAHNMRGHGATYGYPLVTKIAASLYDYARHARGDEDEDEVIEAHIEALRAVASARMTGDGGSAGRELVHGLRLATERQARRGAR
jgi:hypothetical protein